MPLTDAKIKNTKPSEKPQKLSDQGGLYLEVRPNGSKLWRYKFRIAGKENIFAIGGYPEIGLAEARIEHGKARELVKQGINPTHNRQTEMLAIHASNANTFETIAKEWIEKKTPGWTPYYLRQVTRFFASDVYPTIGYLPIRQVTAAHILAILQKAESRGAKTVAMNIRQWCGAVFRYAVATLRADADPAAALKGAIQRDPVKHSKPLNKAEVKKLFKELDANGGYRTTVIALRLIMLTFVRTVELRAAEWSEFDLDGAVWRVPGERMKMRELHIVPLSRQAVELLRELHKLTGNQKWLFPNLRRPLSCMSGTTINRALERMGFAGKDGIGFSSHGFRSTASTMLHEAGYRSEVIERQLAHAERNKVKASYNQAEYMPERIAMMQQWADMADEMAKGDGKVVAIKEAA